MDQQLPERPFRSNDRNAFGGMHPADLTDRIGGKEKESRTLILLVSLASPTAAPSAYTDQADWVDARPARDFHRAEAIRVEARRLDQLPPGRLDLTVLHQVDRCPMPAVLREGIGVDGRTRR